MKKSILIVLLAIISLSVSAQKDTTKISEWDYSNKVDEMTLDKSFYATLYNESDKNNPVISALIIRYSNGKTEVLLFIHNALFNASTYGQQISVKFDDDKIETYNCSLPSDNTFNLLFIGSPKNFLKKIKSSKKLLLKANLYDKGDQIFHFNTDGLQWDYK